MWSIEVTDANGNRLELAFDSDKRTAYIVMHLEHGAHCPACEAPSREHPGCPGVRRFEAPIGQESFRSIARVLSGWPL